MTNIELNQLRTVHSPEPEPDLMTLEARARTLNLLSERVLAACEAERAVDEAFSTSKQSPGGTARYLKTDDAVEYGEAADLGLVRLEALQFIEFDAMVQQPGAGAFQPGTIWLPISASFIKRDVPIDVRVMRFDPAASGSPSRLVPIDVGIAEQYPHGQAGAVLTLEPRYWDDPALPAGFISGRFKAKASLGLVGTAKEPDLVMVVIGCIERPRQSGFLSATPA